MAFRRWCGHQSIGIAAHRAPPLSSPENVDPEEAFIAAIASCHMLFFLSLAQDAGFPVETYADAATGTMNRVENGEMAITHVTLAPRATYQGETPPPDVVSSLHHEAHRLCFIANSVRSEINVVPTG